MDKNIFDKLGKRNIKLSVKDLALAQDNLDEMRRIKLKDLLKETINNLK